MNYICMPLIIKKQLTIMYAAMFLSAVLLFITIVLVCNLIVLIVSSNSIISNVDLMPHNDAAILLGAPPLRHDGTPNLFLIYRVQAAALLLKSGKIDRIVLSGNAIETDAMLSQLKRMTVHDCLLLIDNNVMRTAESLINMSTKFGLKKFTIISQRFHNRRTVFLAKCMGLDVVAFNARSVHSQRWLVVLVRELLACVLVYRDVIRFYLSRCDIKR